MTVTTTTGSSNRNNITPPRVPFLDARTGLISREWFMWLLNMFARANAGAEVAEVVDYLAAAPSPVDQTDNIIAAAYDGSLLGPAPSAYQFPHPCDYLGPAPTTPSIPDLGNLATMLVSFATVSQQLTNIDTTVTFDTDSSGSFGHLYRVGNVFRTTLRGTYVFMFEPQIRQDRNNNVTKFWVNRNGVAIPNSGAVYEAAAAGDNNVISVSFGGTMEVDDQITFHALCSDANGATLLSTPAAAPAPSITAVQVIITGYKT